MGANPRIPGFSNCEIVLIIFSTAIYLEHQSLIIIPISASFRLPLLILRQFSWVLPLLLVQYLWKINPLQSPFLFCPHYHVHLLIHYLPFEWILVPVLLGYFH